MKYYVKMLISSAFIVLAMSSCYRMPTEDDFSLIPSTNNPDYTKVKGQSVSPTMPY